MHRRGRALTGLALGAGIAALLLAVLPGSRPAPALPADLDTVDLAQPAAAARVAPASASARRSVERQPAPAAALPAVDARSIGGSRPAAPAVAAAMAPFSVAVVIDADSALNGLADSLVADLMAGGVVARRADLLTAGRPDVVLALGEGVDGRNEAWYCDPGPEQSGVLAAVLLDAVGPGAGAAAAEAPRGEFPCDAVHAGRARVPAVLLEVSVIQADSSVIVAALEGYFSRQRSHVLAARSAPRLTWPAAGPVTSHYGANHPLGIDIGQSQGPVLAATDGVVAFAGGNACCSYGLFVVVEGADGTGTLYAHLSSIAVGEGHRVRQGDVLGEVGCTGTCFGTHLHFEVLQDGRRQDPMRFLP